VYLIHSRSGPNNLPFLEDVSLECTLPILNEKQIFAPMREGRRVVIDDCPDPYLKGSGVTILLYEMLYPFNVHGLRFTSYKPKNARLSGWLAIITFESAKDAQKVCDMYDNSEMKGRRVRVNISRPPMKYLGGVSWDSGRAGEHFSARDLGNAKGTNFEQVCHPFAVKSPGILVLT
jgi:hypothetical protein